VNDYAIRLRGQTIARGVAYPDQFLAIDNGEATGAIPHGEETAEPARHRLAYWITESQQEDAAQLGYVIVEAPVVLVSHLTEVLRTHAHELLTRQAVRSLLENLKSRAGAVVEEVVPNQIKPGELQRVLQNLLRERVPIRDLETILETVGDCAGRTHDTELLSEHARVALGRTICRQYVDEHDRLRCLMLEPELEELIAGHVEQSEASSTHGGAHGAHGTGHGASHAGGGYGGAINTMPPATAQRIGQELADAAMQYSRGGVPPVVLCAPVVRSTVRKLIEPAAAHVAVLSLAEVVGDVTPEVVGVVGDMTGERDVEDPGSDGDLPVEDGYESSNV
jgi:flagellar biosynthesis protein FlhA